MNCKQAFRLVDAYVDQELSLRDSADLEAHIAECPECRREVLEAKTMKALLGDVPVVGPSEGFEERLVRNVMGSKEPVPAGRPALVRFGFAWVACATVAAAATTFLLLANRPATDLAQGANEQILNHDIRNDLFYTSGTDPLGPQAFPSSYVRR